MAKSSTTPTLTTKQRAALDKLIAARPFHVTPPRTLIARHSRRPIAIPAIIETGINTAVLSNLREMGLIACEHIWLRGHVTPDLIVTAAGELAATPHCTCQHGACDLHPVGEKAVRS